MSAITHYTLDLRCTGERWPDIDIQPEPPLDIDTRPLEGAQLAMWRRQTRRKAHVDERRPPHLTCHEFAERLGLSGRHYRSLESADRITNGWAPVVRMAIDERRPAPDAPATCAQIHQLGELLGTKSRLARLLGLAPNTVHNWAWDGCGRPHGWGVLVAMLAEDLL